MESPSGATSRLQAPAIAGLLTYLVCSGIALSFMLVLTQHQLVFTLDDPMIHMSLARGIAHGHYGINSREFASPSSSLLWPYLLAIFGKTSLMPLWALGLNLASGLLAAFLLGLIVQDIPYPLSVRWRCALVVLGVFVANLVGLTVTGMEHTLQLAVCLAATLAVTRSYLGRPAPAWCVVAAVLAPSIRYEDLTVTLAVAVALWARDRRRLAAGVIALSVVPLLLFSVYLHHLKLPLLPLSVLVKGGVRNGVTSKHIFLGLPWAALKSTLTDPQRTLVTLLTGSLAYLALQEKVMERRIILAGAAAAALGHLLVGRVGWDHRYEVYLLAFATCMIAVASRTLFEGHPLRLAVFFLLVGTQSYTTLLIAPDCARSIYLQQLQMGRFARQIDPANVAVNDLGWVAYEKAPDQYVFDLAGLGSLESNQQKVRTEAWKEKITSEHNIALVMRYQDFVDVGASPASWTELGSLSEDTLFSISSADCVILLATPNADRNLLTGEMNRFAASLPAGATWLPGGHCPDQPRPRLLRRLERWWRNSNSLPTSHSLHAEAQPQG